MSRPSLFKTEFCAKLVKHMAEGLSYESFAGRIGVSRRVLFDWEVKHPEFLHAKEIGVEKSRLFWERAGIRGAFHRKVKDPESKTGFSTDKTPIIPAVWIFNMKNRFQWRDRHPDDGDVNLKITGKPDDEIEARIQAILGKDGAK